MFIVHIITINYGYLPLPPAVAFPPYILIRQGREVGEGEVGEEGEGEEGEREGEGEEEGEKRRRERRVNLTSHEQRLLC